MSGLKALVFDVDGTLADTEDTHRQAFNLAFHQAGLAWHWDVALYTRLLEVSGGKERIRHHARQAGGMTAPDASALARLVQRVHALKTAAYGQMVGEGAVRLRPGVAALLASARRAGLRLAIATTTSPANIGALLGAALGAGWPEFFEVIEDAASAAAKKPHPQVYRQALQRLGLRGTECLAFEDSVNGLAAARAAGLPVLVTPTAFTAHHDFSGALRVLPHLQGVTPDDLRAWHAAAARRPQPSLQ